MSVFAVAVIVVGTASQSRTTYKGASVGCQCCLLTAHGMPHTRCSAAIAGTVAWYEGSRVQPVASRTACVCMFDVCTSGAWWNSGRGCHRHPCFVAYALITLCAGLPPSACCLRSHKQHRCCRHMCQNKPCHRLPSSLCPHTHSLKWLRSLWHKRLPYSCGQQHMLCEDRRLCKGFQQVSVPLYPGLPSWLHQQLHNYG